MVVWLRVARSELDVYRSDSCINMDHRLRKGITDDADYCPRWKVVPIAVIGVLVF
jgi:hypothetical protein